MNILRTFNMRFIALGLVFAAAVGIVIAYAGGGLSSARAQTATTTPEISSIMATTTDTTAHITWTTDEPATSQVAYGTTTDYAHHSFFSPSLITNHSVFLTNLAPDTLYNYRVISGFSTTSTTTADTATSSNRTFTTATSTSWMDLSWLKNQITMLLSRVGILEEKVADLLEGDDDNGNGTSTPPTGDAYIEQDGITVGPGAHVDFAGKNFGPEELVTIRRDGTTIGRTAFSNLEGSFTTGSIVMPTTAGTYTFTFTGEESGEVAEADITVTP